MKIREVCIDDSTAHMLDKKTTTKKREGGGKKPKR